MWGFYTSLFSICVDHRYVFVCGPDIDQDILDSFRQCFDRAGLSVGEVLLVNDLAPAPVLIICNVHCCRIGITKKG